VTFVHPATAIGLTIPLTAVVLRWIAAAVLFLELPVPFYWFILRPNSNYSGEWPKSGRTVAVLSWPIVAILLALFRSRIFLTTTPHYWEMFAGMAAILLEFWLIVRAKRGVGLDRKNEIGSGDEIESDGTYGRMRHPRYAGMIGAVVGAGLLCATTALWIVLAIWTMLVVAAVVLEERRLQHRFGAANLDYSRRVPRFVPNRFRARLE